MAGISRDSIVAWSRRSSQLRDWAAGHLEVGEGGVWSADQLGAALHHETVAADAPTVTAARGHRVAGGDVILTRLNDASIPLRDEEHLAEQPSPVRNGQRWSAEMINPDNGRIAARRVDDNVLGAFPTDYVREHITHGYAVTVHSAQGVTADTTHAVLGENASRALLYVAMTRGRHANTAWIYQRSSGSYEYDHQESVGMCHENRGRPRGRRPNPPHPGQRPTVRHRSRLRRARPEMTAACNPAPGRCRGSGTTHSSIPGRRRCRAGDAAGLHVLGRGLRLPLRQPGSAHRRRSAPRITRARLFRTEGGLRSRTRRDHRWHFAGSVRASSLHRRRTQGEGAGRRDAMESASLHIPVDHSRDTAAETPSPTPVSHFSSSIMTTSPQPSHWRRRRQLRRGPTTSPPTARHRCRRSRRPWADAPYGCPPPSPPSVRRWWPDCRSFPPKPGSSTWHEHQS